MNRFQSLGLWSRTAIAVTLGTLGTGALLTVLGTVTVGVTRVAFADRAALGAEALGADPSAEEAEASDAREPALTKEDVAPKAKAAPTRARRAVRAGATQ